MRKNKYFQKMWLSPFISAEVYGIIGLDIHIADCKILQIGVYRRVLHMYFSFRGERKVPKDSPHKGVTHGASLKKPTT